MNNVKKQLHDCNIIKYIVSSKIVDLWEYVLQPISFYFGLCLYCHVAKTSLAVINTLLESPVI